jgi:1,4-alpha-glucan branching enzyme
MVEKETKKGRGKKRSVTKKKENLNVKEVEFSFYAPEAKKVYLAGGFNQWNTRSLPMRKDEEGIWRRIVELNPGSYEFKFFVDGAWFEDLTGAELVSQPLRHKKLCRRGLIGHL